MLRADMRRDGLCMCGHVLDSSHDFDCRHCARLAAHVATCRLPYIGSPSDCATCKAWETRESLRTAHAEDEVANECRCRHCNANRMRGVGASPMPFEPDDKE